MDELKLQEVTLNDGDNDIVAETDVKVHFVFNRMIAPSETMSVRVNLQDNVFHLERTFDDINITKELLQQSVLPGSATGEDKEKQTRSGYITMKFPEELAGGDFKVTFYLKPSMNYLNSPIPVVDSGTGMVREVNITIISNKKDGAGRPLARIDKVYIGYDDNLQYDKTAPERTSYLHRNECLYIHILTYGLYGAVINADLTYMNSSGNAIMVGGKPVSPWPHPIRIKNNICCFEYPIWADFKAPDWIRLLKSIKFDFKKNGIARNVTANIILTADSPNVVAPPPTSTALPNAKIEPILREFADCRIEFRPDNDYDGSFGFSWYRKGELNTSLYSPVQKIITRRLTPTVAYDYDIRTNTPCNDQSFDQIMGRHYQQGIDSAGNTVDYVVVNGNNSSSDFRVDSIMADNHKKDYRRVLFSKFDDPYYVPVMTLRKGETAILRLFHHTLKEVQSVYFEFDNRRAIMEGFFDYEVVKLPASASTAATGTGVRQVSGKDLPVNSRLEPSEYGIKLTCLKEFSQELRLNVYATPKLTFDIKMENGKVIITAIKPTLCIPTPLSGSMRILPNDVTKQRNIKVVFFNVKTQIRPESFPKLLTVEKQELTKFLAQAYVSADIEVEDIDLTSETNPIFLNTYGPSDGTIMFLYSQRNNLAEFLFSMIPSKYETYYKIFFINEECENINGFSSGSREKFTVVFSTANDSTPIHELGHALGLPHTFDGSTSRSKYVYQDGFTDNIMDYSHLASIDRQSFFEWQWRAINLKL